MDGKTVSKQLQRSILLYGALIILAMGIITAIVSLMPLYSQLKKDQQRNLLFALQTRTLAIDQYLWRAKDVSLQIASRTAIRRKLEVYNQGMISLDELVIFGQPILSDALNQSHEVVGISRLDQTNKLVIQVGLPIPEEFWPLQAVEESGAVIRPFPIALAGKSFLVVEVPILNNQGIRVGRDIVLFSLEHLQKIVSDYTGLGETGQTILGTIHNQRVQLIFPLRGNPSKTPKNLPLSSAIGLAIEKAFREETGILFSKNLQEGNSVIAYGPIVGSDWSIAVEMSREELYSSVNHQIFVIGSVILALSLVATGGMVLLLRPLTGKMIIRTDELEQQTVELKQSQDELQASQARLSGILELASEAIISVDENQRIQLFNQGAEKIFGYTAEQVLAQPLDLLLPERFREAHRQHIHQFAQSSDVARMMGKRPEIFARRQDGTEFPAEASISKLELKGEKVLTVILRDITERKQAEEQLQHIAFYDSLTELPNRALFMDRLEHVLQRAKRNQDCLFAVLFLDLDDFKLINDSLGHLAGDRLLKEIARRLRNCLRPSDTLARLGGDEFTILLEELKNLEDAIKVAERIHNQLSLPFKLNSHEIFPNTSIGITLSTMGYDQPKEILRDADTAMYRAKTLGKGRYEVFDSYLHQSAVASLQLKNDLRRAIERQEFLIYYQPIRELATGRLTGFEALLRWQHPERGFVSPAEFIPVAEETGSIVPLGQWILSEACRQMKAWQEQLPTAESLKISVNLSGKQLTEAEFIEKINQILTQTGLDSRSLKLEITESTLMENVEVATKMLRQLRARKINLSLDDFGTGYSSLSYLHRFPLNTLKIDRSFVSRMKANDENSEIIRAIVTLAHTLGMDVTAEGVETQEQLEQLKLLRCEQGQGYLFSRPLNQKAAEALLWQSSL